MEVNEEDASLTATDIDKNKASYNNFSSTANDMAMNIISEEGKQDSGGSDDIDMEIIEDGNDEEEEAEEDNGIDDDAFDSD